MTWKEYLYDAEYAKECEEIALRKLEDEQDDEDKEGGIGVREPRKPIKPSNKDSIQIPLLKE